MGEIEAKMLLVLKSNSLENTYDDCVRFEIHAEGPAC